MDIRTIRHIVASSIQINWQALWWSAAIVGFVAFLQLCRVLPKGAYSRWRMGLLLTATLTPLFLCLWTCVSIFVRSSVYEVPFLWQGSITDPHSLNTIRLSGTVQSFVLGCYGAWLIVYPAFVFFKTNRARQELRNNSENAPYWSEAEGSWQGETWTDLLRRFSIWRRIRVIEMWRKSPMTFGFFRPVIVVTDGLHEGSIGLDKPERFRAVIAHELAHIRYHSLWTLIHRFAVWVFPLPQFPVWLFNWLRKRFMRLQMDTAQASNFIGVETADSIESADESPKASRLVPALRVLFQSIPDPATLMDVEFELHADFIAVQRGGADPIVLKEALLDAVLLEVQDSELSRRYDEAKARGSTKPVLDSISKSEGLFGVHHARFMEFPPDKGVSLWTKIGKTAASLTLVYPVAVAIIPALVFLAETGSELTQPPAPGFAAVISQPALPPVASESKTDKPVTVTTTTPHPARPEQPPSIESRTASNRERSVAYAPTSQNRGAPEIPSPPRSSPPATQPQLFNTSAQDAAQRVAVLTEQQRFLQDNLSRQQLTAASLQRQQDSINRSQQMVDSMNRNQNQAQAQARASQVQDNVTRANQQMQQTTRFVNQSQVAQNSQWQQRKALNNAMRVNGQNERILQQQNSLNNTRATAAPYIPPAAVTQPRIYIPSPVNTYTPPHVYSPPPRIR